MNWEKYKKKYADQFVAIYGDQVDKLNDNLTYAKNLFNQNVPIIFNSEHFSRLVGYNLEYLYKISNNNHRYYRTYKIPKSNYKELRTIEEPLPDLKHIQKWILTNILENMVVSRYAKAYKKHNNLMSNVRFHRNREVVLKLDIKNFFNSINIKLVINLFEKVGYSKALSVMLANLVTLNGRLTQGSPTSPIISNIIMVEFDKSIATYCNQNNIKFTRYADDMTFSGNDFSVKEIIHFVKKELKSLNLFINNDKTRVLKRNMRQIVTGIVVNEKFQTTREYRKRLRQEVYYIHKFGLESHMNKLNIPVNNHSKRNYCQSLIGKAHFMLQINKNDEEAKKHLKILTTVYDSL